MTANAVSIVVPLADGDDSWRELLPRLPPWETLIAASTPPPNDWRDSDTRRWITCQTAGRGVQMNEAAGQAAGEFLWFVHADSIPSDNAADKLLSAVTSRPRALHYFDLRFYDGGVKMRLNEWGVRLRCFFFNNPFGDQGLCISRDLFTELGGYPDFAVGEDHLFVLKAARAGVKVTRVGAVIQTSARTYQRNGWAATMCRYQKIWWQQWRQR